MGSADHIRERWLEWASAILQETDHRAARELLHGALLESFHAFAAARAPLAKPGGVDAVVIFGRYASPDPAIWPLALERAGTDHPIFAYHNATSDPTPVTLLEVGERGWPVSEFAASMIESLGLGPHQLSLPLATSGSESATYGFVSDEAYLDRDRETANRLQPIVRGLDSHIRLLEQLRPACPADLERPLTPREHLVLALIAQGRTAEGIGIRLEVSPRTVHKHQENLYRKLGAVDRLSAVLRAQQCGLLPQPPADADERPQGYSGSSHTPASTASMIT